jgi:hypothetical protein
MQKRKISLLESISNTFIGMLLSFGIQVVIYPALDIPVTINQNIIITVIFTAFSIMRGYAIRRMFNYFQGKK